MRRFISLVLSLPMVCAVVEAQDGAANENHYILSFEERDRFEGIKSNRELWMLEAAANGKVARAINIFTTGPLWREEVPFTVKDPSRVRIAFRLAYRGHSVADPEIEIGNVRVHDAKGGEVELAGEWEAARTSKWFLLEKWHSPRLPSYRTGFTLRRAYGAPLKDLNEHAEWVFTGALKPLANLQLRRLFEYVGCYDELNFYDDFKNVCFEPERPRPGEVVTVIVTVRNAGSLDVSGVRVRLSIDGKPLAEKRADIPASTTARVDFEWRATSGFHAFLAHADPDDEIREQREEDNWLLRTLIVGDVRAAHPYLLVRNEEAPALRGRVPRWLKKAAWYQAYYRGVSRMAARDGDLVKRYEEPAAIAASCSALLALLEDDPDEAGGMRQRAVGILKTLWQRAHGGIGDRGCSIAHYALAYDWTATGLSAEENRVIRRYLARATRELIDHLRTRGSPVKGRSLYPGETYRSAYSQVSYINACAVVLGALALTGYDDSPGAPDHVPGEPSYGSADAWLHFGMNAIYEEIIRPMTSPSGYYREGHGYMHMAENRSGAACWLALAQIGANAFNLYPTIGKMHELFIRDRLPNGWCPPINDNRATSALPQILFANLYPDERVQAAARWDWKTQTHTVRGTLPDGHYGGLFFLFDTPEEDAKPASPPSWKPTQFLSDYLVFRGDWSPEAAYLCLNSKHWPTTSHSHDQLDKMSFLLYAKRGLLAVDPGYGNTAPRPLFHEVLKWCRGSNYAHNQVVVDGKLPNRKRRSPYTYWRSPFPENCFSSDWLDFGEAYLHEWDYERGSRRGHTAEVCIIAHRRSVLFLRDRGYFVLVDNLRSMTDNEHTFEFVLHGNCRRPYYSRERMGEFVSEAKGVDDVPLANNLKVEASNSGLEARWLIENEDGKSVAFRAFMAAPSSDEIDWRTGDGWLAYIRPVARNKFFAAKVERRKDVRFLTVLYPDLVDDPRDDVKLRGVVGSGARITFADGTVHLVAVGSKLRSSFEMPRGEFRTDADIAFVELTPNGSVRTCFVARGRELQCGDDIAVKCAAPIVLTLRMADKGRITGHFIANQPCDLSLRVRGRCRAVSINGKRVPFEVEEGWVVARGLHGEGDISVLE